MRPTQTHKEFEKALRALSYRHPLWRVFSDFCEMAAIGFSNAIIKDEDREKRYMEIVSVYEPAEVKQFPPLLTMTADGLEPLDCDFLGEVFQAMELSNHWHGQFFTPFHLCKVMAAMTLSGSDGLLKEKGFITVQEPACGAGATLIGLAAALREKGVNYQQQIHVSAIDVDPTAAHMCYIQLSLLHIPAIVYVGNTLSMEMRSAWYTPAHHLGLWDNNLWRGYALGSERDQRGAELNDLTPVVKLDVGQLAFDFVDVAGTGARLKVAS